ncbi:hypothetical protein L1887_22711 [Cichorium endivia]|nr:hypothetical protein L1887_22711 [Cichorium endivia]
MISLMTFSHFTIEAGRSILIVCEAGAGQKPDSAAKRARQAEKRRLYNKAHKLYFWFVILSSRLLVSVQTVV